MNVQLPVKIMFQCRKLAVLEALKIMSLNVFVLFIV